MDFVWVAFFILALVFRGQSWVEAVEQISDSCYEMCPPGYFWYTAGDCGNSVKKYFCKKCKSGSYMDLENYRTECIRCGICGANEMVEKPCLFNSSIQCDCKPGYFYIQDKLCWNCSDNNNTDNPDYIKKCTTSTTINALSSTTTSTSASVDSVATKTSAPIPVSGLTTPEPPTDSSTSHEVPGSKTSNFTPNPAVKPVPTSNSKKHSVGIFSLVILATLLVLFWFLVFCGSVHRYQGSYPCWRPKKNVTPAQDETFKEQGSHHGSAPMPLTFTISEETPMMSLCQDPPAHICDQIPDTDQTAARQEERSDSWPAIVLYAIIKEVPLRRWKEFLRLLSVPDQQMERVELEASLGSIEKQYQMLRLWSQRSAASLNDVYTSLHHMELSGCAQLLQESLEKLQWRQGSTA